MKITLVGPVYPYRGGIAWYTTTQAARLLDAGHAVQVISFARQYPAFLYPGKSDRDPGLKNDRVAASFILDPLYPWTWLRAVDQIAAFGPDLVLIQWWTTFWGPAFYALGALLRRKGIKTLFVTHNVVPHDSGSIHKRISVAVLKQGWGCVTLSPKETARLAGLLPGMRVFASRLPEFELTAGAVDKNEARARLVLPPERPVLLFFGIVRPYKGLGVLLDALALLKTRGFTPLLVVAGEFWEGTARYEEQVARLGIGEQVRMENRWVPEAEMGVYYSAADAFVAPHVQGTQSGAIRAAMGYGLPVLASSQISQDLDAGSYPLFIHPAGDAGALAGDIFNFFNGGAVLPPVPGERAGSAPDLVRVVEGIGGQPCE